MKLPFTRREEKLLDVKLVDPKSVSLGRLYYKAVETTKIPEESKGSFAEWNEIKMCEALAVPYLIQVADSLRRGDIPQDQRNIYERILSYSEGMAENDVSMVLDNKFIFLPEVDRLVDIDGLASIVEKADKVNVKFNGYRRFNPYRRFNDWRDSDKYNIKIDRKNRAHIRHESEFKDMDDRERAAFFIRHMDLLPVGCDETPTVCSFEVSHKRKRGYISIVNKINFGIKWQYSMAGNDGGYWVHDDSVEVVCKNRG